jgi:ferrous iron transport protein B
MLKNHLALLQPGQNATISQLHSESKSGKFAMISVAWSIGLAWVASFIFYQSARALGF